MAAKAVIVGVANVDIQPDFSKFEEKYKAGLSRVKNSFEIAPKLAGNFASELKSKVEEPLKRLSSGIKLTPKVENISGELKSQVEIPAQRAAEQANRSLKINPQVQSGYKSKLKSEVTDPTAESTGKMNGLLGAVGGGWVALGAGIAAGGTKAVDKTREVAGETLKLQRVMGGTVQDASRLRFAAEESGVSFGTLSVGARKLATDINGGGKALSAMGISTRDASGHLKSSNEVMAEVADHFSKMPAGAQKSAEAIKLFGRSGTDMLPMLNRGSEGMQKLYEESDKTGNTLSTKTTDSVKSFNQTLRSLQGALSGAFVQIGSAIMPVLSTLMQFISTTVIPLFQQLAGPILTAISAALGALLPAIQPLIQVLGGAFATIVKALTPIISQVANIIAGILTQAVKMLVPFISQLVDVLGNVMSSIAPLIGSLLPPLADLFGQILVALKPLFPIFVQLAQIMAAQMVSSIKQLLPVVLTLITTMATILVPVIKAVVDVFTAVFPIIRPLIPLLTSMIMPITGIGSALKILQGIWSAVWAAMKSVFDAWWGFIQTEWKLVQSVAQTIFNAIKTFVLKIWNDLWSGAKAAWQTFYGWITSAWQSAVGFFKGLWTSITTSITNIWNGLFGPDGSIRSAWNTFSSWISGVWTGLKATWSAIWGGIKDGIGSAWNGIVTVIEAPINLVISGIDTFIGAANKVLGVIHAGSIPTIPKLGGNSSGSTSSHNALNQASVVAGKAAGGLLVGPGTGTSDSILGLSAGGVPTARVSNGEYVVNARATTKHKALLDHLNFSDTPAFASGGILGDVLGVGKSIWHNTVGKAVDWGKEALQGAAAEAFKYLGDPIMHSLVDPVLSKFPGTGGQLAKGTADKIYDGVKAYLTGKDDQTKAANAGGSGSPISYKGGAGVEQWRSLVLQALKMEGISDSWVDTVLRRMNQESGGNPNAINNWDSNAAAGDPSKGLLQTIGSTFNAYHWPGTSNNIYDPLANIAAAINYAVHRYGSLAGMNRSGGYALGGQVNLYDDGGLLMPGLNLALNKTGAPEPVLTKSQFANVAGGGVHIHPGAIQTTIDARGASDPDAVGAAVAAANDEMLSTLIQMARQGVGNL